MGKHDQERSATRSRSPRRTDTPLNENIPEIFRTKQRDNGSSQQTSTDTSSATSASSRSSTSGTLPGSIQEAPIAHASPAVSLDDLKAIAADIKSTLSNAISDLKLELQGTVARLDTMETMTSRHDHDISSLQHDVSAHTAQLRDLHRSIEDLENRNRRHNIRLRGLPESIEQNLLSASTISIFNDLLGRPPEAPIEIERLHRALRPRGRDNEPPRDVIGCIVNFRLKEEIMRQARLRSRILFRGTEVKLYHDLSQITLQKRKTLRPLTDVLRERNIPYRWKFPFCLQAGTAGQIAFLRNPEDARSFCEILNIPLIPVQDWHLIPRSTHHLPEEPMEVRYRDVSGISRRRRPSATSPPPANHRSPGEGSVPASPAHRKARKD